MDGEYSNRAKQITDSEPLANIAFVLAKRQDVDRESMSP